MCTLDGMEARRVLQVTASSGTFTARNLEITRGKVNSTLSGEANGARGGGVLVSGAGDTIFEHCVLTRNVAMTSSNNDGDRAYAYGGAVHVSGDGNIVLEASTLSSNQVTATAVRMRV